MVKPSERYILSIQLILGNNFWYISKGNVFLKFFKENALLLRSDLRCKYKYRGEIYFIQSNVNTCVLQWSSDTLVFISLLPHFLQITFFLFWLIIPKAKFCFVLFLAFGFFGTLKLCFLIFVLKMYQKQRSCWIWKGCREYRASDIPEEGKSSKLHTSFHSPCYPSSNFLDIHQLSRDWWPILHPSLVNILLHISDRKFRFTNLTVCFINSFPYLLLPNTFFSTKPMNYLLEFHVHSPYVLINEVF